ncbi:MAG: Gfo/Idh/MocA family protein, partial [Gemmatimonadota bacterium]
MSSGPVDLVFLGCGAAATLHSRTLRGWPDVRRHYASRDGGRAAAMARRWSGAGHFSGYDAALADPAIDVAFVATPTALHLPLTLAALEHGKHVIVEKPAFLDAGELDQAVAGASRAGRHLLVAENYPYKPLARVLRTLVEERALGDILFIHLNALKRQRTGDWRDDPALAGGGALFEGGIHWISLLTTIGLTVAGASAVPAGPDDRARQRSALLTLRYVVGAVATLAYSW